MVESKIIDLQAEDDHVNILLYGASGIGKTVLAGSDDKVLFIAAEDDGTLSAKRFGSTAKKWPVKKWDDIVEALEYLEDLADGDGVPFNWIIIDSATEMQQLCMRAILDEAVAENPSRDPDIPAIQDWQKYYELFKRMAKRFNAMPVNVLWTALEQDAEDEEGNVYKVPLLQGKGTQYAKTFASWMTSFGYMAVVRQASGTEDDGTLKYRERRVIIWRSTDKIMAKDRTRCLEPRTVDLTLKQIREKIESGPVAPKPEKATGTAPARKNTADAAEKVGA